MMANPRRVAWGWNKTVWQSCWLSCTVTVAANGRSGCICERGRRREGNRTSADLALLLAMVSSLRDRPLHRIWWCLVKSGWQGRSARCQRSGTNFRSGETRFSPGDCSAANVPKKAPEGMQIFGVKKLPTRLACSTTYNERYGGRYVAFDYLKTAIKQQGCTLQQVAMPAV